MIITVNVMSKTKQKVIGLLAIFIILKIVDLFFYNFPLEIPNDQFRLAINLTISLSIIGISIIILISQSQNIRKFKYSWSILALQYPHVKKLFERINPLGNCLNNIFFETKYWTNPF